MAIVAAALAIGVGGGGLGGLRAIGQAINGPKLTQAPPAADRTGAGEAGRLLRRVRGGGTLARAGGPPPATAGGPATTAPGTGGGTGVTAPTTGPRATPTPGAVRTPAPQRTPVAVATTAPVQTSAPPVSTGTPSVVRQVGDGVKSVTDQVPVAGQPVGQVVDLLVQTVDGLQPKQP